MANIFFAMKTQRMDDRVVEIDSNYNLMQVFNAINEDRTSMTFVYQGVKFWREEYVFMVERDEEAADIGDVVDFEAFRNVLLRFDQES